jgi:hypothetical protein
MREAERGAEGGNAPGREDPFIFLSEKSFRKEDFYYYHYFSLLL